MTSVLRAETVGSLLRPEYLKQAWADFQAGQLSAAALAELEDRAVDEAVALQEEVGLDVVSDGEMRRRDFMAPLYQDVEGTATPGRALRWKHITTGQQLVWHIPFTVTGKLRATGMPVVDHFAYAAARAHRPVKQTLPSPLLANWGWNAQVLRGTYADPFELLADAAALLREQARALAAAGCRYIQIDAPDIAALADSSRGEVHPASGIPVTRLLSDGLELVNGIAAGIGGVTFALHLCRGNIRSHYITSGGYAAISRPLFARLTHFDVFLLEYDDERSGGFVPLADCPQDKMVVLGLVSSKLARLEEQGEVAARVEQAAAYHPRERLALSTQCGFATELEGNQLSQADQRAKLRLVADLAHRLWP